MTSESVSTVYHKHVPLEGQILEIRNQTHRHEWDGLHAQWSWVVQHSSHELLLLWGQGWCVMIQYSDLRGLVVVALVVVAFGDRGQTPANQQLEVSGTSGWAHCALFKFVDVFRCGNHLSYIDYHHSPFKFSNHAKCWTSHQTLPTSLSINVGKHQPDIVRLHQDGQQVRAVRLVWMSEEDLNFHSRYQACVLLFIR